MIHVVFFEISKIYLSPTEVVEAREGSLFFEVSFFNTMKRVAIPYIHWRWNKCNVSE